MVKRIIVRIFFRLNLRECQNFLKGFLQRKNFQKKIFPVPEKLPAHSNPGLADLGESLRSHAEKPPCAMPGAKPELAGDG